MTPTWPQGFDPWYAFAVIFVIATFQFTKAWLMWSKSVRHDRLGNALVTANVGLGGGYAYAIWNRLYPHVASPWEGRVVLTLILLTVAWSLFELIRTTELYRFARSLLRPATVVSEREARADEREVRSDEREHRSEEREIRSEEREIRSVEREIRAVERDRGAIVRDEGAIVREVGAVERDERAEREQ